MTGWWFGTWLSFFLIFPYVGNLIILYSHVWYNHMCSYIYVEQESRLPAFDDLDRVEDCWCIMDSHCVVSLHNGSVRKSRTLRPWQCWRSRERLKGTKRNHYTVRCVMLMKRSVATRFTANLADRSPAQWSGEEHNASCAKYIYIYGYMQVHIYIYRYIDTYTYV